MRVRRRLLCRFVSPQSRSVAAATPSVCAGAARVREVCVRACASVSVYMSVHYPCECCVIVGQHVSARLHLCIRASCLRACMCLVCCGTRVTLAACAASCRWTSRLTVARTRCCTRTWATTGRCSSTSTRRLSTRWTACTTRWSFTSCTRPRSPIRCSSSASCSSSIARATPTRPSPRSGVSCVHCGRPSPLTARVPNRGLALLLAVASVAPITVAAGVRLFAAVVVRELRVGVVSLSLTIKSCCILPWQEPSAGREESGV
jgi:hypothetical protein